MSFSLFKKAQVKQEPIQQPQSALPQTRIVGTGEPVFKKDLSGPAVAALLASKISPEDYENTIIQFLSSRGLSGTARHSPEEMQKIIGELSNVLLSKYGGLINQINPNLIK